MVIFLSILTLAFRVVMVPVQIVSATNTLSISPNSGTTLGGDEITISSQEDFFKNRKIVQIDASNYHSLAIDDRGQVYAWGVNWNG